MNKLLFTLVTALAATTSMAVGLYVPQGDATTLAHEPLQNGEMCWIPKSNFYSGSSRFSAYDEATNTFATLYIGNDQGHMMRVIDDGALRGTVRRTLDDSEVSIATDINVVTTGDGIYTMTNTVRITDGSNTVSCITGRIDIVVASHYVIDDIQYDRNNTQSGLVAGTDRGDIDFQKNRATITVLHDMVSKVTIRNIKVIVREAGEESWVNDLTARTWLMKDLYGRYDLADLRYWTTHLYDGNRGEHWANYTACNDIMMNDKRIVFSTNYNAAIGYNNGNFAISMYGIPAMQIWATTEEHTLTGELRITAVDKNKDSYDITYFQNIQEDGVAQFDPSQLIVIYADNLEGNSTGTIKWRYLSNGTDFTVTDYGDGTGLIKVSYNIVNDKGFYRLYYNGIMTDTMRVVFNSSIHVKKSLYLTGDDGVVYKISVNNGVVSAIAQ